MWSMRNSQTFWKLFYFKLINTGDQIKTKNIKKINYVLNFRMNDNIACSDVTFFRIFIYINFRIIQYIFIKENNYHLYKEEMKYTYLIYIF